MRRFSIAGLIGLVCVFALGLAALRLATVLWTAAAATITLALLLTAVVGAVWLKGAERAYWTGFALFGWAYILLVNWEWLGGQFGHDLTSGFGDLADQAIPLEISPVNARPAHMSELMARHSVRVGNFLQIARNLMALAFALLGGYVALAFANRADPARRDLQRPETTDA